MFTLNKQAALEYSNIGVVQKYARDQNVSLSKSQKLFDEVKKFLYVCVVHKGPFSPSKQIDEMWHTFILFTRSYADFCNQYLGRFVHHAPDPVVTLAAKAKNNENYHRQFSLIVDEFDVPQNEEIWPLPSKKKF